VSHVLISYARSTAGQAQQVAAVLRDLGHDVWLDDAIPAHRAYAEVIEERLCEARAVAVAPFTDPTGTTAGDDFADGLVAEIATALARFPALRVMDASPDSAARYLLDSGDCTGVPHRVRRRRRRRDASQGSFH
jgi:hypothetical protein